MGIAAELREPADLRKSGMEIAEKAVGPRIDSSVTVSGRKVKARVWI